MGFVKGRAAEGLWMTLNGGAMQLSRQKPEGATDPEFNDVAIKSGGYGIIDVAWKVRDKTGQWFLDWLNVLIHTV